MMKTFFLIFTSIALLGCNKAQVQQGFTSSPEEIKTASAKMEGWAKEDSSADFFFSPSNALGNDKFVASNLVNDQPAFDFFKLSTELERHAGNKTYPTEKLISEAESFKSLAAHTAYAAYSDQLTNAVIAHAILREKPCDLDKRLPNCLLSLIQYDYRDANLEAKILQRAKPYMSQDEFKKAFDAAFSSYQRQIQTLNADMQLRDNDFLRLKSYPDNAVLTIPHDIVLRYELKKAVLELNYKISSTQQAKMFFEPESK